MIYAPKPGQRVRLNYARKRLPHQGREATVRVFNGRARGPRNVLVEFDDGSWTIVPRGNVNAEKGGRGE